MAPDHQDSRNHEGDHGSPISAAAADGVLVSISAMEESDKPQEKAKTKKEEQKLKSRGLAIADLALRIAALVVLIVALAVLASSSDSTQEQDSVDYFGDVVTTTVSVKITDFDATKYGLAASTVGITYSIYQLVSSSFWLIKGQPMLPGYASSLIAYIGDQIVAALLLSGGTSPATLLQYAYKKDACTSVESFCSQVAGGTAMIFIGFTILVASMIISGYSFFKKKY